MPVNPVSASSPVSVPSSTAPARPTGASAPTAALPGDRVTTTTTAGAVPATGGLDQASRWSDAGVSEAFGAWLPERWDQWKAAHEEADCKTAASRMMEDFRQHYQQTTGITLPDPFLGQAHWSRSTAANPQGLTAVVPRKGKVRPEYVRLRGENLIDGPNHRLLGFGAHDVATRATTPITQRNGQAMVSRYHGQGNYPRNQLCINQDLLQPGDVIFQQHTHPNDNRWDHTMTVVGVEKDEQGHTRRLKVAIGSYDDLNDNDAATPATGPINQYAYEQEIEFANGEISDAHVTWQTDAAIRPLGVGENLQQRIHRAQVVLGAEQRNIEVHRWGRTNQ